MPGPGKLRRCAVRENLCAPEGSSDRLGLGTATRKNEPTLPWEDQDRYSQCKYRGA